eukprot:CAMPEP_0172155660 /NCGR_PEP_ID=MMETSP1050-20130122/2754_1 /TAXON_ID=233186 /ORGANISM="Cryptomonas curvata, Strain CCAP979/52" /LENGTH=79 /DNA_ID=CAMNT_0012824593 /DNA_START=401 /DNA_END=636 /DNA_ORIENTATION=-
MHRDIVRMRKSSLTHITCDVTCIPVVPCYGAQISHVLLLVNTDGEGDNIILPGAPPSSSEDDGSIEASSCHSAAIDAST